MNETPPDSFRRGSITARELHYAGWLSVFYAIISIPILAISVFGAATENEYLSAVTNVLTIISSLIWVYLLITLRKFLEARFKISSLNIYVRLLIAFTVVMMVLSLFPEQTSDKTEFSIEMIVYFLLFIPYGIVTILFGRKLLSIKTPYRHLKTFSWFIIAAGICMASVVLFLLAIPIGIVSDILLALLFFNGRRELTSAA